MRQIPLVSTLGNVYSMENIYSDVGMFYLTLFFSKEWPKGNFPDNLNAIFRKKNSVMRRQRKCQIGDTVGFNNQLLELKLLDMSGKWYSVLGSETVKNLTLLTLF